ncbi:MAG TPA: hypothetical protein DFS52_01695 [Myxococcales bacterium]|jgi:hypothetical protein|nr:hypothetical protein [Myxococcales bacterium]
MSSSKPLARAVVALASLALVFASGCELFESIQAEKVLAATVLSSPEYDFNQTLFPDGGQPFEPDGGLPADGGLIPTLGPQMAAEIFFGERNSDPTAAPKGIAGAEAVLTIGGRSFRLADKGSGNYALNSQDDPDFKYESDAEVKLTIEKDGESFTATVTAPKEERIEQFHATPGKPLELAKGENLQLTRAAIENVAFTTVMPMSAGAQEGPTYTDMPTEPLDLLDLVAGPDKWKTKVITVPGTAFPEADTHYVVNVSAVAKGETSTNLFTTSAFLVGTADLGLVKTK